MKVLECMECPPQRNSKGNNFALKIETVSQKTESGIFPKIIPKELRRIKMNSPL